MRPLTGVGSALEISPGGGTRPEWRRDGKELFYMTRDGTIMAVSVGADGRFGEPTELFRIEPGGDDAHDRFDVAADGGRFLILEQDGPPVPLTLIQNWTALRES